MLPATLLGDFFSSFPPLTPDFFPPQQREQAEDVRIWSGTRCALPLLPPSGDSHFSRVEGEQEEE